MPRTISKKQKSKMDISVLRQRSYDALFLSDIHFLISDDVVQNAHRDLLELLESMIGRGIKFRDIYLVGDIVENWYFSSKQMIQRNPQRLNRLFDLFAQLWNEEGSLYYITGNHDTTALNQSLDTWLKDYLEKRNWILCDWYQNAHFIAIHGHQGQYGKLKWCVNILGVRIMYALGKVIPGLFNLAERLYNHNLNHRKSPSNNQTEKYYRKLSKIFHRRDRLMITGHTHEFLCLPDQKLLNTGDWLESRSLVIQDHKVFTGYKLEETKLISQYVFDLKKQ